MPEVQISTIRIIEHAVTDDPERDRRAQRAYWERINRPAIERAWAHRLEVERDELMRAAIRRKWGV